MRASNRLTLSLAVCFFAATCLACSRSVDDDDPGRVVSDAELTRINNAVAEYQARMNQEQFDQIWDAMRPNFKGHLFDKEGFEQHLSGIHQRFGAVTRSTPARALARPSGEVTVNVAVRCLYETEAEKGKYVDEFLWHLIDGETKLVDHNVLFYDEEGRLYKTMTLHTGLGPNDLQTSKITFGSIQRNIR